MCPECQSPHPQQLELGRLLTEDETVLSLSMPILFTLALALYFETFETFFLYLSKPSPFGVVPRLSLFT